MSIFQLFSVFFALLMLYVVTIHKKKSRLSPSEVGFWFSIWIFFIIIAIFPNLLLGISNALNFTRVFDLLVVGGMMILTVIVIINYFQQKDNNIKLDRFVREDAIKKAQKVKINK